VELECRKCGAPIAAEDVHVELAIAKCASCHAVLDLASRQTVEIAGGDAVPERRSRAPVPLPTRFQVVDTSLGLSVTWRWIGLQHLFMVFFCVAWDGVLLVWYGAAISQQQVQMMLFGSLHAFVGVGITYATLAGLLNRTRVEVRAGVLSIRHSPLPWPGNRELHAREIDQLYCVERIRHSRNSTRVTYELNAIRRRDGRTVKLIGGLDDPQQALFLEQQIEEKLRIEDRPVGGELARRRSA
jgi:hypothetical protein